MVMSASPDQSESVVDAAFIDLFERLAQQLQLGQPVNIDELARDHPEHAQRLRQLLPAMQAAAELGITRAMSSEMLTDVPCGDGDSRCLGDFRLIREIGRGGMGVVYEAEQISLNRTVALKVLPFAAILDERRLQRFQNESRAAATLQHPHIVAIHSVGVERGVYYYAMQLVAGRSMDHLIAAMQDLRRTNRDRGDVTVRNSALARSVANTFGAEPDALTSNGSGSEYPADDHESLTEQGCDEPVRTELTATTEVAQLGVSTEKDLHTRGFFQLVARLGIQAAEAIQHAHDNGVLHRDVKPANLLVDPRGELWVTDFGLARLQNDVSMTMSGDMLGTLRYMSPEQASGKHTTVDHRSDIYSLGVTLYELLTLQPAMKGGNRAELLHQVAHQEPCSPRRISPSIPYDLETIILKAIEKSPEDRYQSAQHLTDDLKRFLHEKPIHGKRATHAQRLRKWTQRNLALVSTTAVTLILSLSVFLLLLWRAQHDTLTALETSKHHQKQVEANLKIITGLARDLAMLGRQHQDTDTLREATLREVIDIQQKLVDSLNEDHVAVATILGHTLRSYVRLAEVLRGDNRSDEAREVLSQYWLCVARRDALGTTLNQPSVPLAKQFLDVASTSAELGDWTGAERASRRSLDMIHQMLRQDPPHEHPALAAEMLSRQHMDLLDRLLPHVPGGKSLLSAYSESRDTAHRLLREETTTSQGKGADAVRNALLYAYLGNLQRLEGDPDSSVATYRKALATLPIENLSDLYPYNTATLRANFFKPWLSKQASEYLGQGRIRDAVACYKDDLRQARICLATDPTDTVFRNNLRHGFRQVYLFAGENDARTACSEYLQRMCEK